MEQPVVLHLPNHANHNRVCFVYKTIYVRFHTETKIKETFFSTYKIQNLYPINTPKQLINALTSFGYEILKEPTWYRNQ